MKKNIVRGSMLAVAALSLMLGGTSHTSSVKEQVSETPAIVSKAIQNSVTDVKTISKGTAVQQVAETTEAPVAEKATEQQAEEQVQVEEKAAKVESNQVVANIDSYLNIRSEASEESEVVGKFYNGNVGTIVEKGDEWSVVSSGNAYGYVKNDYLLFGEDAESYIENNCDQVVKVTAETLNVRAEESTESDVIALSDEGDSFTILGKENDWIKVAVSEDEVGYVASDYVYVDYIYETAVTIEEEQAAAAAEAAAEQAALEEQNQQASQNTEAPVTESPSTEAPTTEAPKQETTKQNNGQETVNSTDVVVSDQSDSTESVKQESTSTTGQQIADYAVQFVGNPYVYGGTSLTNGADCSGFVQSVYKHFGYSLPRVAADQANAGTKVSTKNFQPGDLLFYHGFGPVAMYIGGGLVVHASTVKTGIKISIYDYSPIDKAVRIVK